MPPESVTAKSPSISMIIGSDVTAIAYLWELTPVIGTQALPIYADDDFELPAAPWWISVSQ